jgi:ribosomal protein S18 acetylase RimI-like enzyme
MGNSIIIRKATLDDVDAIVSIHQDAFKNFFLTSLGKRFLKLYYHSFINCDKGCVFCAYKDNQVVGFSACSYVSRSFNSLLIKKNLVKYGIEALILLFTKPGALIRLAKNMNKEGSDSKVKDNGLYAELYSIAVSPLCQGEGVGKQLLLTTENDVLNYNYQVSLTTDYYNNDKTIAFYKALDYENYYEFTTYPNRKMWRMIKNLK